jgi:hypothetical protein
MNRNVTAVVCSIIILAAGGCDETSPAGLPMVTMKIGNQFFQLEVARTFAEQEKGLMERDSMPEDHGMIFVFATEHVQEFWMKNTRFPLDIIFLDSAGKVVSVHSMQAYDTTHNTSSNVPARYAIEIRQGAAAASGVKIGAVLQVPRAAQGGH